MSGDPLQKTESFDLLRMDRQIRRKTAASRAARAAALLGVAVFGGRRGGVLGWAAAGLGLAGLAGEVWAWLDARPEWRKQAPLSLRRLFGSRRDPVDVASAGSFPASDAPSYDLH